MAEGKVLEQLGRFDTPGMDLEIVARRYGLRREFPLQVLRRAEALPSRIGSRAKEGRKLFTRPAPVTIDGETAQDFDDAIRIANDTEYGLTGALFSKNVEKLARARREFHVGNLYLNRKCTGALVDVHPFGGFNMSGTDSKAGSRDYLLLFMQGKSVTKKV